MTTPPPLLASLVERLRKTEIILRSQADYARRIAETYTPERERWNETKGDDRLAAMVRYQLDQESLARSLTKDADETAEAATALEALSAERDALRHILEAITAMQALRYGDATRTHMALIGLCVTARATLNGAPKP